MYKTLTEIVEQLELCDYQTADQLHNLSMNAAFIELKLRAVEEAQKSKIIEHITVTFPTIFPTEWIIKKLEGALTRKTKYTCKVEFDKFEDNENVYNIYCEYGSAAWYCIGMTASIILSSDHLFKNKTT